MRFLKRLALILSLVMVTSIFAACSKNSNKEAESSKKTAQNENKKDKDHENTQEQASDDVDSLEELSDNLYDYEILLDNKLYTLPTHISEFTENGWKSEDLNMIEFVPQLHKSVTLSKGNKTISVTMVNLNTDMQPYSKCLVTGVYLYPLNDEEYPELFISKGITIGSTYNEVIEAYGTPSIKTDYSDLISYKSDDYSEYNISFKDGKIDMISVNNAVANTDILDLVKNYKAPTSLADDLLSFQVKLDGTLYKLPIPIQELQKNGWKAKLDPDTIIPARSHAYEVELTKNNQTLRVPVMNYSIYGAPLKYCFVNGIIYSDPDCIVSFELPKGITTESTLDQVLAAYGEPSSKEFSQEYASLVYKDKSDNTHLIQIEFEKGKLSYVAYIYTPEVLK
ncbi:MAG: hypothetical protein GX206_04540 [Clostridiales bacterium]|nr:hypothetical protein [Clostridiales bacterium]